MTVAMPALAGLSHDLLAVLDEVILLEEAAAVHLAGLSAAVIGGNRSLIEDLADQAMETHAQFETVEVRRRAACGALAAAVGCPASAASLRRLARELPGEDGRALDDRRRRIEMLVRKVRCQHLRTAVLLQECARVNHALLVQLFPQMQTTTVYGAAGLAGKRPGGSLVDARS